jgi:hypothetical protein
MPTMPSSAGETEPGRWSDQCGADATALVEQFGAEGVAWLDSFLADYLFVGEPLDRVLIKARELSRLAPRPHNAFEPED